MAYDLHDAEARASQLLLGSHWGGGACFHLRPSIKAASGSVSAASTLSCQFGSVNPKLGALSSPPPPPLTHSRAQRSPTARWRGRQALVGRLLGRAVPGEASRSSRGLPIPRAPFFGGLLYFYFYLGLRGVSALEGRGPGVLDFSADGFGGGLVNGLGFWTLSCPLPKPPGAETRYYQAQESQTGRALEAPKRVDQRKKGFKLNQSSYKKRRRRLRISGAFVNPPNPGRSRPCRWRPGCVWAGNGG